MYRQRNERPRSRPADGRLRLAAQFPDFPTESRPVGLAGAVSMGYARGRLGMYSPANLFFSLGSSPRKRQESARLRAGESTIYVARRRFPTRPFRSTIIFAASSAGTLDLVSIGFSSIMRSARRTPSWLVQQTWACRRHRGRRRFYQLHLMARGSRQPLDPDRRLQWSGLAQADHGGTSARVHGGVLNRPADFRSH